MCLPALSVAGGRCCMNLPRIAPRSSPPAAVGWAGEQKVIEHHPARRVKLLSPERPVMVGC